MLPNDVIGKQSLKEDEAQTRVGALKVLGLSQAIIDFTVKTSSYQYNHQFDVYYVKMALIEAALSVPQGCDLEILKLCFQKTFAAELWQSILDNNLLTHQKLEYWMSLYVDYVNETVNNGRRFLSNGEKLDSWFDSEGFSETGSFVIKCINTLSSNIDDVYNSVNGPESLFNSDCDYWYHGTTQNSAESIRTEGILLEKNQEQQDFSDSFGFYLNQSFNEAKKWAIHRFGRTRGAILIYQFPLKRFKGKNLHEDPEEWKSVVEYFRSKKPPKKRAAFKKALRNVEYIFGPMAENANAKDKNVFRARMIPDTSQLCIKLEKMAIQVTSALCGIIYFSD